MRKILFVCEGVTEVFLLYKILKEIENLEINKKILENGNLKMKSLDKLINLFFEKQNLKIFINNLKGKNKLNNFLEEFSNSREIEEISKILFIIDSDFSSKNNEETGFERTKKSIENKSKDLKQINRNLEIDYFITPNNKDDGMTETLIINSLKCTQIVEYMKTVIKDVKEMDEADIKNETKSAFLMIAATQNPLTGTTPAFLSGCYEKINKEYIDFKKIVEFIMKEIN
ncbi:DUF3226 domain-containing protein [Leptotrichia wadei]|nr:DUF3226 domain-containing protein [Leptotrichia wadei]